MAEFLFTAVVLAALVIVVVMRARTRRAPAGAFEGEELGNAAGAPAPPRAGEPELPESRERRLDA